MKIILEGNDLFMAVHETLVCLWPEEHHGTEDGEENGVVYAALSAESGVVSAHARVLRGGREQQAAFSLPLEKTGGYEEKRICTRALKTAVYRACVVLLPEKPQWGAMSGVKPAKPLRQMFPDEIDPVEADHILEDIYDIAPRRRALTIECAQKARRMERLQRKNSVSVYIGIPFCPSKCVYCSFVSSTTARSGHLIEPYLNGLTQEIRAAGEMLRREGLTIDSLYIGGGTPTALSEEPFERLLTEVENALPKPLEYTVEAGRPETITPGKLESMARHGVGRISINPQTFEAEVLKAVGRMHSPQQVIEAYEAARRIGAFEINMDLIAGLPGDGEEGLLRSVDTVIGLAPENITVHCLARKKGSPLRFGKQGELPHEILDEAHDRIRAAGYAPYYLYRQKYSAGNLENVGFARGETLCRYNILMMEELCDVVALGAGGVSKFCADGGRSIHRLTNPKYPQEYIENAAEIALRKKMLQIKTENNGR